MRQARPWNLALAVLAPGLLAVACSSAPPSVTPGPVAPATAAPPTASSNVAPSMTSPTATATFPIDEPSLEVGVPPNGILAEGDNGVVGWLGTYCWNGACADVLQLPDKASLPELGMADGSTLTFSLESGGFLSWRASYVPSGIGDLMTLDEGGADYDPDTVATVPPTLTEAEFDPPGVGDWFVLVNVRFENGDAQYGWRVTVE